MASLFDRLAGLANDPRTKAKIDDVLRRVQDLGSKGHGSSGPRSKGPDRP
jgi:hypothetical protein